MTKLFQFQLLKNRFRFSFSKILVEQRPKNISRSPVPALVMLFLQFFSNLAEDRELFLRLMNQSSCQITSKKKSQDKTGSKKTVSLPTSFTFPLAESYLKLIVSTRNSLSFLQYSLLYLNGEKNFFFH